MPAPPDHRAPASAPGSAPPGWRVVRAEDGLRLPATRRLVERNAPDDSEQAAHRFIGVARAHRISLENMWASVSPEGDEVRHVCLATGGSGRTVMLFTSTPRTQEDAGELSRVIEHACLAAEDAALAQALLEPEETMVKGAFLGAGFDHIADLAYLRRANAPKPARAPAAPPLPDGVSLHRWRRNDDRDLMTALERTYTDTLDCPKLCSLRDTRDVLDSHKSAGVFDSACWWIIRDRGQPEGAMLFNPCPAQQHVELVYFGLSPRLRGRSIATPLLEFALGTIAHRRREPTITCAVDTGNTPALRLYERVGFEPFGTRVALVRKLR